MVATVGRRLRTYIHCLHHFGVLGADSKPQVLHCHYFNEEGYETGNGFGGHFHDYGNGSARCTLDSSDKELSCMAVFQLTQDVDSSGNMTERLVIRSTGEYQVVVVAVVVVMVVVVVVVEAVVAVVVVEVVVDM